MSDFTTYRERQMRDPAMQAAMDWVLFGEALCTGRGSAALTMKEAARRLGVDWRVVELMEDDPQQVPRELIERALTLYQRVREKREESGHVAAQPAQEAVLRERLDRIQPRIATEAMERAEI